MPSKTLATQRKFVVIVGDEGCGKSCLFESEVVEVEFRGRAQYRLILHDTQGHSAFDSVRPISYMHADLFLVCFAIDSPDSLRHVGHVWCPEVRRFCPDVPIVLVGTKWDLRKDPKTIRKLAKKGQRPVTKDEGRRVAENIAAFGYVECSGKTRTGIAELIQVAASCPIMPKLPVQTANKRKTCALM